MPTFNQKHPHPHLHPQPHPHPHPHRPSHHHLSSHHHLPPLYCHPTHPQKANGSPPPYHKHALLVFAGSHIIGPPGDSYVSLDTHTITYRLNGEREIGYPESNIHRSLKGQRHITFCYKCHIAVANLHITGILSRRNPLGGTLQPNRDFGMSNVI